MERQVENYKPNKTPMSSTNYITFIILITKYSGLTMSHFGIYGFTKLTEYRYIIGLCVIVGVFL